MVRADLPQKRRWLSELARIRLDGLQAAALAVANNLLPVPVGVAMDLTGLDLVDWTQRRMLSRLRIEVNTNSTWNSNRKRDAADHRGRQAVARLSESAIRQAAKTATQMGYGNAAHLLGRGVPVIGAVVAGIVAYRRTTAIGMAVTGASDTTNLESHGGSHG